MSARRVYPTEKIMYFWWKTWHKKPKFDIKICYSKRNRRMFCNTINLELHQVATNFQVFYDIFFK